MRASLFAGITGEVPGFQQITAVQADVSSFEDLATKVAERLRGCCWKTNLQADNLIKRAYVSLGPGPPRCKWFADPRRRKKGRLAAPCHPTLLFLSLASLLPAVNVAYSLQLR